jgi:hypothetical protein
MAPAPLVQQPEHGKAHRTAEVIGADRVLPATAAPSSIQGEVRIALLFFGPFALLQQVPRL